ncbi:modification protein of type I restriction-modification system [Prevotella sp. MGM1]|nr:modification protein of type I restriction-modification system [Prevotella sp. MGM1]
MSMDRIDMIHTVGRQFLVSNIENNEFSYQQVIDRSLSGHYKLDIRFFDEHSETAVLIETKRRFTNADKEQLFAYVALEQELNSETNIIAILANTDNDQIKVWKFSNNEASGLELADSKLKSFEEYKMLFIPQNINDRNAVLENTSKLNKILHDNGIPEKLRSQFVGTCLLALKERLKFKGLSTSQINAGIKEILASMLHDSLDRAKKLLVLQNNILESQSVSTLRSDEYQKILLFIKKNILPYINEYTTEGHDILSYFFTTFNKYVAREDKNQAFTPNHIAHFMCKAAGIHRNIRILDPTCGSGTFLVQAMSQILKECETASEKKHVKEHQIYGIEFDENVYGLATTNMLIHGDGNSNIQAGSCFDKKQWIESSDINLVLMNPPYNASKNQVPTPYARLFGSKSTDPTKGLGFVQYIADAVNHGKLLTLLPMACALTSSSIITDFKEKMLQKHTLDAVFSLPPDMFYPGASAVAICMVFNLGQPHPSNFETFFGYYRVDGFEKRKGVGRVDINEVWDSIESEWLSLYRHRLEMPGKSVNRVITSKDEWCAEAYMETDYSVLSDNNFISVMKSYAAYLTKNEPL